MPRTFISHASEDREDVEILIHELERRGIDCWYSDRDILGGLDFADEIMRGLADCDSTLILLSKDSVRSPFVRREVEVATENQHILYPVRLFDVALSNELSLFLKVGEWVDLYKGAPEKIYDQLAEDIKNGQGIRPKPNASTSVLAGFFLLFVLVVVGAAYFLSQQIFNNESQRVTNDLVAESPFRDIYFDRYSGGNFISTAQNVRTLFYGLEEMKPTASVSFFQSNTSGGWKKIGEISGPTTAEDGGMAIEVPVIALPEDLHVCATFISDRNGEKFLFSKRFQPHTTVDPNQVFKKIPNSENCDSHFSTKDNDQFGKELEKQQKIAIVEKQEPFALTRGVRILTSSPIAHKMSFTDFGGAENSAQRVSSAEAHIYGSTDRQAWQHLASAPLVENGKFIYTVEYRRDVPNYVRVCAVTKLTTTKGYIESEAEYRSIGSIGEFEIIPNTERIEAVFDEASPCNKQAQEATAGKSTALQINPLTEVLSLDSEIHVDPEERNQAITRLKAGQPKPFGHKINGLRLGMPFNDALKVVRKTLPFAEEATFPFTGPFERIVHFHDGQRYRTVTLAEFPNVPALAAVTFEFSPEGRPNLPKELKAHAVKVLGPNSANGREEYADSVELSWNSSVGWCDYAAYSEPVLLASYDPLGCTGVYIEYRVSYGGRGTAYGEVGLFDSEVVADVLGDRRP